MIRRLQSPTPTYTLFPYTSLFRSVHASGRTDAVVHARGQVAHVDLDYAITPFRLSEALNAQLRPDPVAIIDCRTVNDDWHARFSCIGRAYERSEEHTSELQSLMRISYAVFCLKKKKQKKQQTYTLITP